MKHPLRFAAAAVVIILLSGAGLASAQSDPAGPPLSPTNTPTSGPRALRAVKTTRPISTEDVSASITPCRIVDTRVKGGAIAPNVTRTYYVGGTLQFVNQGGKSGGCGIPVGATSISAIVTSISATGSGFVRAFPANKNEPTATVLNYSGTSSEGTGATLAVDPAQAKSLKVKNYGSSTQIVIDVTGYTLPPISAVILSNGSQYTGTTRIVSVTRTAIGSYDVKIDRSTVGCVPSVTMHGGNFYATAYEAGTDLIHIGTWELDAGPTPTPTDLTTNLNVSC